MPSTITLKYPARCAHPGCNAELKPGTRAKFYGRGRVYGLKCHERPAGSTDDVIGTPAKPLRPGEYDRYRDDGLRAMTDVDGQYEEYARSVTGGFEPWNR